MSIKFTQKSGIVPKNLEQNIKKIKVRVHHNYLDLMISMLGYSKYSNKKGTEVFPYYPNEQFPFDNSHGEDLPIFTIYFFTLEDIEYFNELFKNYFRINPNSEKTESPYFPHKLDKQKLTPWDTVTPVIPMYSINIISLGRYDPKISFTRRTLTEMKLKFRIFVEPFEYRQYLETTNPEYGEVICCPEDFHLRKNGGTPVRNYVRQYSISKGEQKHWILDDNIEGFFRFHLNQRIKLLSGCGFKFVENFTQNYTNVGLAGFNYYCFCPNMSSNRGPIRFNGKVYSCILIDNTIDIEWDGTYNEDVILGIELLKRGYVNLEFNNVLSNKKTSGTIKGGNTSTIYCDETQDTKELKKQMGYKKKFDYLVNRYPDVKITNKPLKTKDFHHKVDYSPWKNNTLIPVEYPVSFSPFQFK